MGEYKEVKQSELELDDRKQQKPSRWRSWRVTVLLGAMVSTGVLFLNVGVLVWVLRRNEVTNGIAKIYGDCGMMEKVGTYGHLAINILGTLLLSASNNCAQLLSSPSRAEATAAHKRGEWLDIGVPSLRNLRRLPLQRTCLWIVLMLSSIPLHLLYNSVLFTAVGEHEPIFVMATQDFTHGGWWNETRLTYNDADYADAVRELQQSAMDNRLELLDNEKCIKEYWPSRSSLDYTHGNLLVVTSSKLNDTAIDFDLYQNPRKIPWLCDLDDHSYDNGDSPMYSSANVSCEDRSAVFANADSWIPSVKQCGRVKDTVTGSYEEEEPCPSYPAPVLFCLADSWAPRCTANVDTRFLAIVICCNFLKIVVMLAVALGNQRPLATIGDAITSFLSDPDGFAENRGPLSITGVKQHPWQESSAWAETVYLRRTRRWMHAANTSRFGRLVVCLVLAVSLWSIGLGLTTIAIKTIWWRDAPFSTLDLNDSSGTIGFTLHAPLTANALLANVPQIMLSFVYLFYNNALTSMLLAREYSRFASIRKPLRVTSPRDYQRSTYWLQVPLRYALPLMTMMAGLHWLISRSIFLTKVDWYDYDGNFVPDDSYSGCKISVGFLLVSLILGAVMIFVIIGISFRKLDPGMPLVGSCSLAIAAACSAAKEPGAETLPLQYGVLISKPRDEHGRQYVGFSSKEVAPLEDGVEYL